MRILIMLATLLRHLLCRVLNALSDKAPKPAVKALAIAFFPLLKLRPELGLPDDAEAFLAEHGIEVRFVPHDIVSDYLACYNVVLGGLRLRPRAARELGIPDGQVWVSEALRPWARFVLFHEVAEMVFRARGFHGLVGHQLAEEEELLRWHSDPAWLKMNLERPWPRLHLVALAEFLRRWPRLRPGAPTVRELRPYRCSRPEDIRPGGERVPGMGSFRHVELLHRRARRFLSYAEEALKLGDYDLACFYADQAAQLAVKACLLRLTGHVPRIHGLRELLGAVSEHLSGLRREDLASRVSAFTREHRIGLSRLEEAYVAGRYLAREFEREEAEECIKLAREILALIGELEGAVFGRGGG